MKKYGLIGFPLGHSFSKKFFSEKFANENIDAQYDLYELPNISDFAKLAHDNSISGLNVTIPYKEQVMPFLHEIDATAAAIGAVNVIKFSVVEANVVLKGFNTDAIGFDNSISQLLKPHHKKALILGTGGASKAIKYVLEQKGIQSTYVSRNAKENALTYDQLDEKTMDSYHIIVNATPLGTFPKVDSCPDIPYHLLTEKHLLYDVVYNPSITLFMQKGLDAGATVINGEQMLHEQAIAAWQIWQ